MSLCKTCARRSDADPCAGQFSDGHYTWYTPMTVGELEKVPQYVWDSPVYSVRECNNYEKEEEEETYPLPC